MFKLNNIRDNPGARTSPKVLGRGMGSGKGKTSGRGHQGQKARSGVSLNGFEGGQNPIYRRLPKRGFNNSFREKNYELDFYKINLLIKSGLIGKDLVVDRELLSKLGLLSSGFSMISLLNNGVPIAPITVSVTRITKSARDALEAIGGKVIIE